VTNADASLLVVDDIEDNRFMLTRRLAGQGYLNVTTASDGRRALELLNSKPFDLVLLDIVMPDLNGYELLAQIKADPSLRYIPVIMISAVDEIDSVIRCIELGAEDYLPKPFNPTLLRARIGACLERKRLHDQLATRTRELTESLHQQTATADVLKVISRSAFDLQVVLDTLVGSAAQLCRADRAAIRMARGGRCHHLASHGFTAEQKDYMKQHPWIADRSSVGGRSVIEGKAVQVIDVQADSEFRLMRGPGFQDVRTILAVPLVREGKAIGALIVTRNAVEPFSEKQVELVTTFADQAVIAIENVRLFEEVQARTRELFESLERQTATSEVLEVISSSGGTLEPVFDAMLTNAIRICEAKFGNFLLYENGGFRHVMLHGAPPAYAEAMQKDPVLYPKPGHNLDRVAKTKSLVHVPDLMAQPPETMGRLGPLAGARTLLVVPVLKDDALIGAFGIYRQEVRPFADKQIELVQNFASQAVIAIENTRLLNELRQRTDDLSEALEQQTATSEVLQVISSSPGELAPVFDSMLANATRICQAAFGSMLLGDGNPFRRVALHNAPQMFAEFSAGSPLMRSIDAPSLDRLVRTKQVVHVADLAAEGPDEPIAVFAGARTLLIVPMLKENALIGAMGIYRQEVRPFNEKQIALVTNFARQAVIAIENTRLLNELRESLQQQTATTDVLRVISSSPGDLTPVFQAMLENAVHICDARFGNLLLYDGDVFRHVALHNAPDAWAVEQKRDPVPPRHTARVLYRIVATKQVMHIADMAAENLNEPIVRIAGARTVLIVPMLKENELIGVIAIYRQEVRPFTAKQIELVQNFAAQAVIAIENTRLLN
jgi:two-component system, NtrC family, sensor kinase